MYVINTHSDYTLYIIIIIIMIAWLLATPSTINVIYVIELHVHTCLFVSVLRTCLAQ